MKGLVSTIDVRPQVMEVDGAMVPLVGGEWTEVKTMVIGHTGKPIEAEGEQQVVVEEVSSFRFARRQAFFPINRLRELRPFIAGRDLP